MTTAPETDARITALLRRTLEHAEALAREVREALGEDIYGSPCRRHGWRDCEDITCREIAEAVAAEREQCARLAERHRAHYGCYVSIEGNHGHVVTSGLRPFADLIRETT